MGDVFAFGQAASYKEIAVMWDAAGTHLAVGNYAGPSTDKASGRRLKDLCSRRQRSPLRTFLVLSLSSCAGVVTQTPPEQEAELRGSTFGLGSGFTCARHLSLSDLHVRTFCWGETPWTRAPSFTDAVLPVSLPRIPRIPAVVAGDHHACALGCTTTPAGSPLCSCYCWGVNSSGQLGVVSPAPDSLPVLVSLSNPVGIYAASESTCALTATGEAYCWGRSAFGLLGASQFVTSSPRRVQGLPPLRDLALGRYHACALSHEHQVWCWGINANGQLGPRSVEASSTPAQVLGLPPIQSISVGDRHSCALSMDGQLLCWGSNQHGAIGDTVASGDVRPTLVDHPADAPWVEVSCGAQHTCALSGDHVFCWGDNTFGQSGRELEVLLPRPTRVEGISYAHGITADQDRSCVYVANRGVQLICWGRNNRNQLGGGIRSERSGPVTVELPE